MRRGPLDPAVPAQQHRLMSRPAQSFEITADILLRAYAIGMFPMAEASDAQALFWVDPKERGIFPLDGLILSRSFVKTFDAWHACLIRSLDWPRGVTR